MNRKEGAIVGLVLLVSFMGGAFAAPAFQNIFITNDPLNVRIVGGTTTLQTTGVVIQVPPTSFTLAGDRTADGQLQLALNFTAGFAFAPLKGFVQVNKIIATLYYQGGLTNAEFLVELNGHAPVAIESVFGNTPMSAVSALNNGELRVGANLINISTAPILEGRNNVLLHAVWLTVEYTFFA